MKMFVPLLVGLFNAFLVLESLGLFMCIKKLEIENFCFTTFGKTPQILKAYSS